MNIVRLDWISAGGAKFVIDYGGKRATISLENLETTGGEEETDTPWHSYYRKCLKELFDTIQAEGTIWRDSDR